MVCLINQREHAQSVSSNITIFSITCKEEDNVLTLVSEVYWCWFSRDHINDKNWDLRREKQAQFWPNILYYTLTHR